jgi:hypothetical protein
MDLWVSDDEQTIWAAGTVPPPPGMYGGTGTIVRMMNTLWSVFDQGLMDAYWTVWGSGMEDVWFGGTGVATDFPNAKHWVGQGSALETSIISDMGMTSVSGMSGTGPNDVWAVLREGEYPAYRPVYRYQGTEWTEDQALLTVLGADQDQKPLNGVYAVQGASFYAVYAVGDGGKVYHFDGSAWHNLSITTTNALYDAWVNPISGETWVVGEGGSIYRKDAEVGAAWELQTVPPVASNTTFYAIGAAGSDLYVTGAGGVTLRLVDGAL